METDQPQDLSQNESTQLLNQSESSGSIVSEQMSEGNDSEPQEEPVQEKENIIKKNVSANTEASYFEEFNSNINPFHQDLQQFFR